MAGELKKFAEAISEMKWRDLMKVSNHIVSEIDDLRESGNLDDTGMAAHLLDASDGILRELEADRAARKLEG